MQLEWKVCVHGVLRTRSFLSICMRQMGQTLRSLPRVKALNIGISVQKQEMSLTYGTSATPRPTPAIAAIARSRLLLEMKMAPPMMRKRAMKAPKAMSTQQQMRKPSTTLCDTLMVMLVEKGELSVMPRMSISACPLGCSPNWMYGVVTTEHPLRRVVCTGEVRALPGVYCVFIPVSPQRVSVSASCELFWQMVYANSIYLPSSVGIVQKSEVWAVMRVAVMGEVLVCLAGVLQLPMNPGWHTQQPLSWHSALLGQGEVWEQVWSMGETMSAKDMTRNMYFFIIFNAFIHSNYQF